jgi:hypothetical protein
MIKQLTDSHTSLMGNDAKEVGPGSDLGGGYSAAFSALGLS